MQSWPKYAENLRKTGAMNDKLIDHETTEKDHETPYFLAKLQQE